MKKPTRSEKIVLPYSKDISNVARSLYEENKPVTIMVDLTQESFDRGLKSRVAEMLTKYGNIVRNAEWSRVISLRPYNLRSVRMLEMHYYADRLDGVRELEISAEQVCLQKYGDNLNWHAESLRLI